jgi:predicted  nucleic acid-binding Zn-ribbon protein
LRRKVKELEQKLKAQEEARSKPQPRPSSAQSDRTEKLADLEEEVIFLRETIQEHEVEIERLREEAMSKEIEKRKLADYVKVMSEERRSTEDTNVEETIDMWKDLLQAETARREQADEDAEKLREEVRKLKEQAAITNNTHNVRNVYQISKRQNVSYGPRSEAGSVAGAEMVNGDRSDSAASTLVEQLKHENAELRRDLSAQTSMLTSRNRERERLQQEIEDLKLNQRRHAGDLSAVRSIAGDSIFERSVSRAHNRAESRMSGNTRLTQLSDAERDDYERRQADLRDELAQIKMVNQDLERELNAHLDILQNVEAENKALKEDKNLTMEDLKALQSERDEAITLVETLEEEAEDLRKEALAEIEALEQELEQKIQDFEALQQEMKIVSESVVRLEDELSASRRKEQQLEQQLEETEAELERTIEKLRDTQNKNERLDVQLESSQNEISFLREEQEADKIKIGELEASLSAAQTGLQDERERISEERRQREIVDSQEKADVQKILDELNEESNKYKDESKRLRKNLERKETEASQWKERLETLESNLKEALGDLSGTRSSILKVRGSDLFFTPERATNRLLQDVTKLTRDLEHTMSALEHCQHELSEKERILRARDALLESAGLESRKLSDLLEKERAGRRADRNHFEQMQRSQQSLTHTIQQNDQRVAQIENARKSERRKYDQLEQQLAAQLSERNNLLLTLWNRLSTLCGAEFVQRNALIHDAVPSVDVIAKNLPGYARNVNHALKTLEGLVIGFRTRIREVERSLFKDFQTLEHAMDVRTKRIDHLEKMVEQQTRERLESDQLLAPTITSEKERRTLSRSSSRSHTSKTSKTEELSKLKNENKLLKAELQIARAHSPSRSPTKHATKGSMDSVNSISGIIPAGMPGARSSPPAGIPRRDSSSRAGLARHHSASAAEALSYHSHSRAISRDALPGLSEATASASAQYPPAIPGGNIQPLAPSEQRWIHRLKELERRLKAEREARLLDRSGARKRLEESNLERDELRMMLEKERMLRRESVEVEGVRGDERLEDTPRQSVERVEV